MTTAVYGVFDPLKKNIVRFVELIKCLNVLDNFEYSNEEKLLAVWDVNMEFGQDMSPFDVGEYVCMHAYVYMYVCMYVCNPTITITITIILKLTMTFLFIHISIFDI